jgi:hypothetical protein
MGGLQQPTRMVRISMRPVPFSEAGCDSLLGVGAAGIEVWLGFRALVFMIPRFG